MGIKEIESQNIEFQSDRIHKGKSGQEQEQPTQRKLNNGYKARDTSTRW